MSIVERARNAGDCLLTEQDYLHGRVDPLPTRRPMLRSILMDAPEPFQISFGNRGEFEFTFRPPEWLIPLLQRIGELGRLPPNWNSYGAAPIDPELATLAIAVLHNLLTEGDPPPSIVPTSDGGVQFEWHTGGIDLEIEIQSPISIGVLYEDGAVCEEYEFTPEDLDYLREKLTELRCRLDGNNR